MKILILDIETAPHIAYVWRVWKENISTKQLLKRSHIMSFASKWLGKEEITYHENRKADDYGIVSHLYELLDQADIVVAHNGVRFDLPTILGRGVVHGLTPPSPYKIVDTCLVARKELRMAHNSLAGLCEELGLPRKQEHKEFPGFELWLECLRGNDAAWKEMQEYNVADILSLEALYLRLRPYMRYHPNVGFAGSDGGVACPKCGFSHIEYRGYFTTKSGLNYRKFRCLECGGWGRVRNSEKDKNMGVNAV